MKRWVVLLEITDDGLTGEPEQEGPVYLLSNKRAVKGMLERCPRNSGIAVSVKYLEESLP